MALSLFTDMDVKVLSYLTFCALELAHLAASYSTKVLSYFNHEVLGAPTPYL